MPPGNSVTVFCGAHPGRAEAYANAAAELGRAIARANLRLVHGGAAFGLTGVVANAALSAGGTVIGVIPESLGGREVAHTELTEPHVVPDLHRRKALMALPGGLGTAEEFLEVLTRSKLGLPQTLRAARLSRRRRSRRLPRPRHLSPRHRLPESRPGRHGT